jgi:glycosyltransferase involved in cell wall biosynthesis
MANIHILYYNFKNTSGNHAGMAYLAKYLNREIKEVTIHKHLMQEYKGGRIIGYFHSWYMTLKLLIGLKKTDKVFFLEYMTRGMGFQDLIARRLKMFGKKNELSGMVHLAGNHLKQLYFTEELIRERLHSLDKVLVLGSSLKTYLDNLNIQPEVITTFHYVDTNFYKPELRRLEAPIAKGKRLQVIFMGSIKRNFELLKMIILQSNENIDFHLCMGYSKVDLGVADRPNVNLYGFMEEEALLALMQKCDVNLSVLQDTIGSNVITGSLAVGLVQVVSNVGSIKDYCSESNSCFCDQDADFINALNYLSDNPEVMRQMKIEATKAAAAFSIQNFREEFKRLV